MTRRQFVLAAPAGLLAAGCRKANPVPFTTSDPMTLPGKIRVLFVCVENSNRSQMAQAFAAMHGGDRVEALSAGSRPSGKVNPKAVAAMAELGYDLTAHSSKSVEQFNGQEIDAAVTMGCGDACPLVNAKTRHDWQIPDPREMPPEEFRKVRDLIGEKVKGLLAELGVS
ncbi:MAG TPA: arsenate reductase ArsC [Gemmata sp.]|nr:arsenate reductase ArsC [Gemmata sp.]